MTEEDSPHSLAPHFICTDCGLADHTQGLLQHLSLALNSVSPPPGLVALGQPLPAAMAVLLSTLTATAVLTVTTAGSPGLSGGTNCQVTFSAPEEELRVGRAGEPGKHHVPQENEGLPGDCLVLRNSVFVECLLHVP